MTEQAGASAPAPIVRHVPGRHRYEIEVGGTTAGFTAYRDRDGQRVFYHTEIGPEFAGQGLGPRLVREALHDVSESGRRVVPVCPFVDKYLSTHDEFADLADPVTEEIVRWLEDTLS